MNESIDRSTPLLFLDVCMKIEGLCAEIYYYFSEVFKDHPDASQLWKKTALEEENHRMQFELALKLKDEIDFELNPNDLSSAYLIHNKLIKLLSFVKGNTPDLLTAFTKAVEMEEYVAHLHVQTALRFMDDSMQKMFIALGKSDQEHVDSLQRYVTILSLSQSEMRG